MTITKEFLTEQKAMLTQRHQEAVVAVHQLAGAIETVNTMLNRLGLEEPSGQKKVVKKVHGP